MPQRMAVSWAESRGGLWLRPIPAALTLRAQLALACAEGTANSAVARRHGMSPATVGKWRRGFIEQRIAGLHDELRPGQPRTVDHERLATLMNTMLHSQPRDGSTHWTIRGVAAETGISKTSVHRHSQLSGAAPHRTQSFKLSADPFSIEKLRDAVGLYLSPPDDALVLCVDERSQVQALERTRPLWPLGFRHVESVTGRTAGLASALRAGVQLVAEPGRALLCPDHWPCHPARLVPRVSGAENGQGCHRPAADNEISLMVASPRQQGNDRGCGSSRTQAKALALSLSNSAWVIVPASSKALASAMSAAGDLPATVLM